MFPLPMTSPPTALVVSTYFARRQAFSTYSDDCTQNQTEGRARSNFDGACENLIILLPRAFIMHSSLYSSSPPAQGLSSRWTVSVCAEIENMHRIFVKENFHPYDPVLHGRGVCMFFSLHRSPGRPGPLCVHLIPIPLFVVTSQQPCSINHALPLTTPGDRHT